LRNTTFVLGGYKNSLYNGEFPTSLVFPVPLRGDKANDVHREMNFICPVKDIKAMEIEVKKNIYMYLMM